MVIAPSVILLEFNELTPSLMSRFIGEGKLPNFKRLYEESSVYTTDAEEDGLNLNPWIQWVTVHSGLPFREHGVFYLDDGHKLKHKCVWDVLSDSGVKVWICGSMNPRYDQPLNGAILPDPWCSGIEPYPPELSKYYKFIQRSVQEHTNEDASMSANEYAQFLGFMLRHGMSLSTVWSIGSQLWADRRGRCRWKRTAIMDQLQWDLFKWYYETARPAFSTFFLNSTAHLQHKYWRNMAPSLFKVPPSQDEQVGCEGAILFGYQNMDRLVGRFIDLAGTNTTLMFCTALSQQPCLVYEDDGGKTFYRPRQFDSLLRFAGITQDHTVTPVMSEEFQLRFANEGDARDAADRLQKLEVNGMPAMLVHLKGDEVFAGCSIHVQLQKGAMLVSRDNGRETPFFEVFYQGEGLKSGMHHRDGMLWIRYPDRQHAIHEDKVSLCAIAPTILSMFGIAPPANVTHLPIGHSNGGAATKPATPGIDTVPVGASL